MFLECEKFNPKNKNYLVETIGHKLQYVIYCFTTLVIAKLVCLANIPTPDNISSRVETHFHLFSLLVHWSKLKKKILPMQCTIIVEVYAKEVWRSSLFIIALTGGSVAFK